jgi:tRNA pseudouridine13 synthase
MKLKVIAEDFVVEERLTRPCAGHGAFAVFRVQKRDITTMGVQAQMARQLQRRRSDIVFPALKDRRAVAVQHAAIRGTVPDKLVGKGFEAKFVGRWPGPLRPTDIAANRFVIVVRDLSETQAEQIAHRLEGIDRRGLPNYFDEQRFGSRILGAEPIGKRILQRDAEGALHAYLAEPFVGDPEAVRRFKQFAAAHWEEWQAVFEAAPKPSNFRSVLTYLRDHPFDEPPERVSAEEYRRRTCRKALNLVNRRLLSIYLAAYQSLLWNRIAGRYLDARLDSASPATVVIAGEELPIPLGPALEAFDPAQEIDLPMHRTRYRQPQLAAIAKQVLAGEGLAMDDLKARILDKAYPPRGGRRLFVLPEEPSATTPGQDERFAGRYAVQVGFTLPRGSYATLILKALVAD